MFSPRILACGQTLPLWLLLIAGSKAVHEATTARVRPLGGACYIGSTAWKDETICQGQRGGVQAGKKGRQTRDIIGPPQANLFEVRSSLACGDSSHFHVHAAAVCLQYALPNAFCASYMPHIPLFWECQPQIPTRT
eukprot:6190328-Pleurochrysis_carterae.AAC.1